MRCLYDLQNLSKPEAIRTRYGRDASAYGYHDGRSEVVMGNALRAYPRDSFYLADKFPGYDLANIPKVEEIFEEQLKRCGVEYFDFYLFHNVCEMNIGAYLDPQYGIYDYLLRQKANGRIRHLGFSVHGSYDVMQRSRHSRLGNGAAARRQAGCSAGGTGKTSA